jgi:uncharacterized spore protein YtfJ
MQGVSQGLRGTTRAQEETMDFQEAIAKAHDAINAKRVYGDPYERDGMTLIPAAAVGGGAGGGGGEDTEGKQRGSGGGFGVGGRPVGAYVIQDGTVRWEPAIDVTQVILRAQLAALILLLAVFLFRRRGD